MARRGARCAAQAQPQAVVGRRSLACWPASTWIGLPHLTVYRMKSAAERHDGPGLSEFIEFPMRQSSKTN